jgi:membrane fusion protein (multidrug efflux system)
MPDDAAAADSRHAAAETSAAAAAAMPPRRRIRRAVVRWTLLLIGPVAAALAGGYVYISGGRYVSTENAYVKADKVTLGARVSGTIVEVPVKENQYIAKGEVLFRLDDGEYRVMLAKADADLAEAVASIRATKANYREMGAELELVRGDAAYAEREWKRQADLAGTSAASKMKLDAARHDMETARRKIAVISEQLTAITAALGGDVDAPVKQHPRYRAAKATRDRAALDIGYAIVKAPFAGIVRNVPSEGRYVNAGMMRETVISLIADRNVWIEANFKETDLTHIRPGQQVAISVDTYPAEAWTGTVESISQATGAEFSLLPAQNATGNWVKVVQRIPVRVSVDQRDGRPALRAGMSTEVEVDTRHRRPLPPVIAGALEKLGIADAVAGALPPSSGETEFKTRP